MAQSGAGIGRGLSQQLTAKRSLMVMREICCVVSYIKSERQIILWEVLRATRNRMLQIVW